MSGGRVEMGVGAGWNDAEHAALGIPYPDTVERVDRLEEQLAILRGLWDEPDGWDYDGVHYQVRDSALPAQGPAAQPHPRRHGQADARSGSRRATPTSTTSAPPRLPRSRTSRLGWTPPVEALGRDPASLTRSVMAGVLVARDEAEFA